MGFPSSGRSNVLLSTSCAIPFAIVASMLLSSSLVGAVDIVFCSTQHCGDPCVGCWDVAKEECCNSPTTGNGGASVAIIDADVPDVSASTKIFSGTPGSGCSGDNPHEVQGERCVQTIYSQTSGAFWYIVPPAGELSQQPARRLQSVDLGIETSDETIRTVYPNAAFFTEQGKEGYWVLPVSNFTEYDSQVNDLSYGVTLDWFKSQGAFYKP